MPNISSYRGLKMGMSMEAAALVVGARPADASVCASAPGYDSGSRVAAAWSRPCRTRLHAGSAKKADCSPSTTANCSGSRPPTTSTVWRNDRGRHDRGHFRDLQRPRLIQRRRSRTTPITAMRRRVIARWEDADYSCNLVRTGDQSSFVLVLYSKRVSARLSLAGVEALGLDNLRSAPHLEMDKFRSFAMRINASCWRRRGL